MITEDQLWQIERNAQRLLDVENLTPSVKAEIYAIAKAHNGVVESIKHCPGINQRMIIIRLSVRQYTKSCTINPQFRRKERAIQNALVSILTHNDRAIHFASVIGCDAGDIV